MRRMMAAVWLAVSVLAGSEGTASAQTKAFVSGFAGLSRIQDLTIAVTDPALAADVVIDGRKLNDAPGFGGSAGVWGGPQDARWAWGLRGDFTYQQFDGDATAQNVSGIFLGQPFKGPLPLPAVDGSVAMMNGAFLLGLKPGRGAGVRVMPYIGIGAGADRARISAPAAPGAAPTSDTDMTWTAHVMGGIDVAVGNRNGLFAEYRFNHTGEHEFLLVTQRNMLSANTHHVVAGIRIGF
jgi:opacity protein-like surface antigen